MKKRHGIEDERKELYADLETWMREAVGETPFCGGARPNLADLAVFGVMRAVKTFETFEDASTHVPRARVVPSGWKRKRRQPIGRDRKLIDRTPTSANEKSLYLNARSLRVC